MHFLDRTLATPEENLALDEALLLEAEAGRSGEVLRLWEWPAFAVVLGSACRLAEDVEETTCQADGIPIVRRASGGGTVLLGAGCLCFSLVLAYDRALVLREVTASYRYILEVIRALLVDREPGIEWAGISDLAVAGRKFSGNAQQRKRSYLLHQGTLLYAFDLQRLGRYLRQPARQPDYRQCRPHSAFLTNLTIAAPELKDRLRAGWATSASILTWPETAVRELVEAKYGRPEWTRRR